MNLQSRGKYHPGSVFRPFSFALLVLMLVLPWSPVQTASSQEERLFTSNHPAMGTIWQLHVYAASPEKADELSTQAFEEIDRIEDLLSNYRASSELSRINKHAAEQTVTTDPETFRFLTAAQSWSGRSDGAFDLTVGALMKGWGFFRKQGHIPTPEELLELRRVTGWQKLQLDPAQRGVHFTTAGVELDPGGIGKGFAVDAVLQVLRNAGVTRALISAGSSTIAAIGSPQGRPGWPVIVPDPAHRGSSVSTIMLRDMTLSTANCSEKNFTLKGHLYCHIMNPQTLLPVEGVLQVTVLAPSATDSDALSNVLFVQSPQKSSTLLRTLPLDRALIVTGTPAHRVCTAIRWKAPIAPGFCEQKGK